MATIRPISRRLSVACLNAEWRVGIIGVTDEHGTDWNSEEGDGRAGVWLRVIDAKPSNGPICFSVPLERDDITSFDHADLTHACEHGLRRRSE